jgi:hypothetical protein
LVPDHAVRIRAVAEALDRAYGRPAITTTVPAERETEIEIEDFDEEVEQLVAKL